MQTRTIAIIIAFAAVTIVLNPLQIPAPFLPSFPYRIWDIPIIIAFFLFGFKVATAVAALNGLVQLILFPRPIGIVAPIWFFIAILALLIGLSVAKKLLNHATNTQNLTSKKSVTYFTALGILSRVAILPIVDYTMYKAILPLVLGSQLTDAVILSFIPGAILFSITATLYMVPTAYLIAKKVNKTLKIGNQLL